MADEIHGQQMSDYTDIDQASDLTSTEKEYYKANARVTTFGKVDNGVSTPNSNYNIPLSEISGDSLPTIESGDAGKVLTVNANEDGVHWDTVDVLPEIDEERDFQKVLTVAQGGNLEWSDVDIPTYKADYPLYEVGYQQFGLYYNKDQFELGGTNNNELTLTNPVPAPGTNNRGKVLTVDESDEVVWDTIPTSPTYTAGTGLDITSNTISVTLPVPDPGTDQHRGHVLTVNDSDDSIKWAAPQGGGGGGGNPFSIDEMLTWTNSGDATIADWLANDPENNHIDNGGLQTSIKKENGVTKYQYSIHAGSGSFFGPWAS
jgi:hypothetical protein